MVNLQHIATGWGKSLNLLEVSEEEKELSAARMEVCATCEEGKESSFLKLIRAAFVDVPAIYCGICKCPCNEKSLVTNETCPLGRWEK